MLKDNIYSRPTCDFSNCSDCSGNKVLCVTWMWDDYGVTWMWDNYCVAWMWDDYGVTWMWDDYGSFLLRRRFYVLWVYHQQDYRICYRSVITIMLVTLLHLMLRNLYACFSKVALTNIVIMQMYT